jgi:tetratricopeptide (TPR) repeat protein
LALERSLVEIGQQVVQFAVDDRHFDIPLLLSRRSDLDCSVFSVTGLSKGGGNEGANAYRALNMRREHFVDHSIRVIIWLVKAEANDLSRHAPDFWAFRHRVVDFNDSQNEADPAVSIKELSEQAQGFQGQPGVLDEKIKWHEAMLTRLPKQSESMKAQMHLLSTLASLYQLKKAYGQSIRSLKQGLVIARELDDSRSLGRYWENLGSIYRVLNQTSRAIRAYRKAMRFCPEDADIRIKLGEIYLGQNRLEAALHAFKNATRVNPQNANAWINLGHFYHGEKRIPDAIIAYQHAIQLDPLNFLANSSLVASYHLLGKDDLAEEQRKRIQPMVESENEYNKAVFEAVCGNTNEALNFLAIALGKGQVSNNGVLHDPNFNFIRDDPRFEQLSGSDNPKKISREKDFQIE